MKRTKKESDCLLTEKGKLNPFVEVQLVSLIAAKEVGMPPEFIAKEIMRLCDFAEMLYKRETALQSKFAEE